MIRFKKDNMWVLVEYDHPQELRDIREILTIEPENSEDFEDEDYLYFNESIQAFPVGLLNYVFNNIERDYEFDDRTGSCPKIDDGKIRSIFQSITLWDHQVEAVKSIIENKNGVVKVPTGGGKTEIHVAVSSYLDKKSLIVAGKKSHAVQAYERFLELGISDVGMLMGDSPSSYAKHVCAVADFLYSRIKRSDRKVLDLLANREIVSYDEVQHLGCFSWQSTVGYTSNADYRLGLSATPFEDVDNPYFNKRDTDLIASTGETIYEVSMDRLIEEGILEEALINIVPTLSKKIPSYIDDWNMVRDKGIIYNKKRCSLVKNIVCNIVKDDPDRRILVLVEWHDQAYILLRDCHQLGIDGKYVHGGDMATEYRDNKMISYKQRNKLANTQLECGDIPFLIGSRIYEEAEDIPCITDLIVMGGCRKKRKSVQRAGRSIRKSGIDKKIRIWDFYDSHHWMLMHQSDERIEAYESLSKYIEVVRYNGEYTNSVKES